MASARSKNWRSQPGESNPAYAHGHTSGGKFSPTYHSWVAMIGRCYNPSRRSYAHYGGRGIKVCKRWLRFENFLADMGVRPPGRTLDRKDVNGNYTKSNCRWATTVEQARNSRQCVWVQIGKQRKLLVDWCEELGMSINTVRDRVKKHGLSYEEALTRPLQDRAESARHMTRVREQRRKQ